MRRALVTGSAGFIGYHLCQLLLSDGFQVHGYDSMSKYYDVRLKKRRHQMLQQSSAFTMTEALLEDQATWERCARNFAPDVMIHLAAQAGVRYSLEEPRTYLDSNVIGTFNVIEAARQLKVNHMLIASTSSIYGGNENLPFKENDKADTQLTIYAATKKAGESMAHSYAHLWNIPTTVLRLFTVYGPWGRPDMALFKFVSAIISNKPIDIYNKGKMQRDFTYVEDIVRAIRLLIDVPPVRPEKNIAIHSSDTLSPVAPYRIVNIGNNDSIPLLDFIEAIEEKIGKLALRNSIEMQKGDVGATRADISLLHHLTGYTPTTHYRDGIAAFVDWFRDYYQN